MARVLVLEGLRGSALAVPPAPSAPASGLERAAHRAAARADQALARAAVNPAAAVRAFEESRRAARAIALAELARGRQAAGLSGLGAVDWSAVATEYDRQQAMVSAGISAAAYYADFQARAGTCPAGTTQLVRKSDRSLVCLSINAATWDRLTAEQQTAWLALKAKGATDAQAAFVLGVNVTADGAGAWVQNVATGMTNAGQAVMDAAGDAAAAAGQLAKDAACYAARVAADRAMADAGCGAPPFASTKCKALAAARAGLMSKIGCAPPAEYAAAAAADAVGKQGLGLKIAAAVSIPIVLALAMGGR